MMESQKSATSDQTFTSTRCKHSTLLALDLSLLAQTDRETSSLSLTHTHTHARARAHGDVHVHQTCIATLAAIS